MRTLGTKLVTLDNGLQVYDLDNSVVDRLESVSQRVEQHLRFFVGSWFMDTRRGTPHFRDILGHQSSISLASTALSNAILEVDDTTAVRNMQIREIRDTRRLSYSAEVDTIYGPTQVSGEV